MTDFSTKLDSSSNRQLKQFRDTTMILSGTTQFGIPDAFISFTGNTINIDALQYIQARGYVLVNDPITKLTGVSTVLTRDTDGVVVNTPITGFTTGGSGSTTNDYVTSGSFNSSSGDVTLTRLSGGTVVYNLDNRYSLTGHTHSGLADDYVSGGTFNVSTGDLDLVRQSGDTVTVNLDGRYGITNQQKNINGSYTILSSDDNTLLVLSSATPFNITVNSGLTNNFETEFINIGTATVTFLTSGTANLNYPDGTLFLANKVAFLVKIGSTNNHWLKGELE